MEERHPDDGSSSWALVPFPQTFVCFRVLCCGEHVLFAGSTLAAATRGGGGVGERL